jgi:hypothetical protein
MFIEAKKFLETMDSLPSWMGFGGKDRQIEASRKKEFECLKEEAKIIIGIRSIMLFSVSIIFLFLQIFIISFIILLEKKNYSLIVVAICLSLISFVFLFFVITVQKSVKIKLDQFQGMIYDDVIFLLGSPWLKSDWLTLSQQEAENHFMKCLRFMAADVKRLEFKISNYPNSPEISEDEENLEGLREALSQHLVILRQFKLVSVEKSELFGKKQK